jgi:hypothetical protein
MGRVGACSAVELVTRIRKQRSIGCFVVRNVTGATWKTVICGKGGLAWLEINNTEVKKKKK